METTLKFFLIIWIGALEMQFHYQTFVLIRINKTVLTYVVKLACLAAKKFAHRSV